jgi:hypothetical protein
MHKTLRFLALLGAALGIYLAAVLQSGPDQVDANICALGRRLYLDVPAQCAPWINHLAAVIIWLLVAACVIFLVLDLKSWAKNTRAQSQQVAVQRDVWLYDAICRMFLGRWERIPTNDGHLALDQDGFQSIHDLLEHVRQLAFENRLPIWGKQRGYQTLWENAGGDFWRHNQIEYMSFTDGDPVQLRAVPINTSGQVVSLRELMTSRATVDALSVSQFSIQAIWAKIRPLLIGAWSKVEPSHVIVAGLVIAAAGVAWQLSRGKPSLSGAEIAKITAPFQSQIDALKAKQDKPFWNASGGAPSSSPPSPKRYTAYEKEQRSRALDEIYNVFATQLSPAS